MALVAHRLDWASENPLKRLADGGEREPAPNVLLRHGAGEQNFFEQVVRLNGIGGAFVLQPYAAGGVLDGFGYGASQVFERRAVGASFQGFKTRTKSKQMGVVGVSLRQPGYLKVQPALEFHACGGEPLFDDFGQLIERHRRRLDVIHVSGYGAVRLYQILNGSGDADEHHRAIRAAVGEQFERVRHKRVNHWVAHSVELVYNRHNRIGQGVYQQPQVIGRQRVSHVEPADDVALPAASESHAGFGGESFLERLSPDGAERVLRVARNHERARSAVRVFLRQNRHYAGYRSLAHAPVAVQKNMLSGPEDVRLKAEQQIGAPRQKVRQRDGSGWGERFDEASGRHEVYIYHQSSPG